MNVTRGGFSNLADFEFDGVIRIEEGSDGRAVEIVRKDHTSAELRGLSQRCSDGAQVRRILALAMVLDGRSRTEAAELNGMDRQTLRDWVHRYNAWASGA